MQACEVGRLAAMLCFRGALGSHAGLQTDKDVPLQTGACRALGKKRKNEGVA